MPENTFIVDCPRCRAKVAALLSETAENRWQDHETSELYAEKVCVGKCPRCKTLIAGASHQIEFIEFGAEFDEWSDVVRVFPKPLKSFSSHRIPKIVTGSLIEADRSLQAGAHTAACVMFGRALEAVCRNILEPSKIITLAEGIRNLKDKNMIDQRLYEWSQQLHAFRNIAAHPDETSISRQDAEDLQTFVYAIIEYIYDLTDPLQSLHDRALYDSRVLSASVLKHKAPLQGQYNQ
ncbi:DUF4145 domain-containing protein [Thermodesulfobacteriota bacterium]